MSYQSFLPCVACGKYREEENHFHHVYSRGSHPEYAEKKWNMISMCSYHHNQGVESFHNKGNTFMTDKFPSVKKWFIQNNWYVCKITNKWRHEKDEH